MSETTLAAPLSGDEVIEAIVDKVRRMLQDDCYLSPMMAYESFNAKIELKVQALDVGRVVVVEQATEVKSENVIDEDAALTQAESYIFDRPPNEVRQEAGLGIPTLVEDAEGRKEIKGVKYAKKVI
jgi:hypothetical protein